MKEKLNAEYISIISKMRELNKKRYEIYLNFIGIEPNSKIDIKLEMMRTPSIYHDLYGNDLDKK